MGKKNQPALPQPAPTIAEQVRCCDWCQAKCEEGSWWDGQWVCKVCFPTEAVKKKKEEEKKRRQELLVIRRCEHCHKPTNNGCVMLGQWTCWSCSTLHNKTHKNKYAQFSKVDKHQTSIGVVVAPKPQRKKKKIKLKKIIYWTVVIMDITDGKL